MAKKYVDYDGLLYFWGKIKGIFAKSEDIPDPSSTTPVMDGTGATGSSTDYARADHVHPSDTSKAPTSHAASSDTYGKGTSGNYGHVLLSDATDGTAAAASGGTAATPKAVADALTAAKSYADSAAGAANQDAFSYVKVGSTTIEADSETDTLEIAGGTGITVTPDATNDKVTISTSAEANQNAFSNVKVGNTTVEADTTTDTLEIEAGSNVTITPDATNDKVTISATDTTYSAVVSGGSAGLMSGADKAKLDKVIFNSTDTNVLDSSCLPSYVDDVVEAYVVSGATALSSGWLSKTSGGSALTPQSGIIYVLMEDTTDYATNTQFRWATNTYVKLNDGGVSSVTNGEIDTIVAS